MRPPRSHSETRFQTHESMTNHNPSDVPPQTRPVHGRGVSINRNKHRRNHTATLAPISSNQRMNYVSTSSPVNFNGSTAIPLDVLLDGADAPHTAEMFQPNAVVVGRHSRAASVPAMHIPPPPPLPANEYRHVHDDRSRVPSSSFSQTAPSSPNRGRTRSIDANDARGRARSRESIRNLKSGDDARSRARSASPIKISRKNMSQSTVTFGSRGSPVGRPVGMSDIPGPPPPDGNPIPMRGSSVDSSRYAQFGQPYDGAHVLSRYSEQRHKHEIPTTVLYNSEFSPGDDGFRTTRGHHTHSQTVGNWNQNQTRGWDGQNQRHGRSKSTLERFNAHPVRPHAHDYYRNNNMMRVGSVSSGGGHTPSATPSDLSGYTSGAAMHTSSAVEDRFSVTGKTMTDEEMSKLDIERRQFDREASRSYVCRSLVTVIILYAELVTNVYILWEWYNQQYFGWFSFGVTIVIPPIFSQLFFICCHVCDGTFSVTSCIGGCFCAHHCVFLLEALAENYDIEHENWTNMLRSLQGFPSLLFLLMKQYIALADAFGIAESCRPPSFNGVPCSHAILYFSLIFSLLFYVCTIVNRGMFMMAATARRYTPEDAENMTIKDVYFGKFEATQDYYNMLDFNSYGFKMGMYCLLEMLHRTISVTYLLVLMLYWQTIPTIVMCFLCLFLIYAMYAILWARNEDNCCCGWCMGWTECLSAFISVYSFFNGEEHEEPWRQLATRRASISGFLCLTMFIFQFVRGPPMSASASYARWPVVLWSITGGASAAGSIFLYEYLPGIPLKDQLKARDLVVGGV